MSEYLYYVEQWDDDPSESYPVALFEDWHEAELHARRLGEKRRLLNGGGAKAVARLLRVNRRGSYA